MAITNKLQFKQGMNVEAYLDEYFRRQGWTIEKTTANEERTACKGDRIFSRSHVVGAAHGGSEAAQQRGVAGESYYVEYKSGIQTFYTGNVFLETISVDTQRKPGWVYTCQADFIVYAALLNGKILILKPERLRLMMDGLKRQFKEVATKNNQNDGYQTHGVLVPLDYAERALADGIIIVI